MTDSPINDLEGLMAAFGVETTEDLAWIIEESASIEDGRIVTIDLQDDYDYVVVDTIGIGITYPTTKAEILDMAVRAEKDLPDVPFWIIEGHPDSRVIINVPHASRRIPQDARDDIVLTDDELETELDSMTDSFTDRIAMDVAQAAGVEPWIVINKFSRLVVDPERFPDETEEMNAAGMGVIYTKTSTGAVLRTEEEDGGYDDLYGLVETFYDRYAKRFTDLVDDRLKAVGEVTIIDLHSYPLEPLPYELHGDGPRPEICVGTDPFHTPDDLVHAARLAFSMFDVGQDSPFSGCYVPLAHYRKEDRVHAVMIELRRDLYMTDDFELVEPAIVPIVQALGRLSEGLEVVPPLECSGMLPPDDLPQYEEHE